MEVKTQCDSCSHKSICEIKEALVRANEVMQTNYRWLSDRDKKLADSVIFMADCRHYSREPEIATDQYAYESFL